MVPLIQGISPEKKHRVEAHRHFTCFTSPSLLLSLIMTPTVSSTLHDHTNLILTSPTLIIPTIIMLLTSISPSLSLNPSSISIPSFSYFIVYRSLIVTLSLCFYSNLHLSSLRSNRHLEIIYIYTERERCEFRSVSISFFFFNNYTSIRLKLETPFFLKIHLYHSSLVIKEERSNTSSTGSS